MHEIVFFLMNVEVFARINCYTEERILVMLVVVDH